MLPEDIIGRKWHHFKQGGFTYETLGKCLCVPSYIPAFTSTGNKTRGQKYPK